MKIESSNLNFNSRSVKVRQADAICRMVRSQYPSISPSRIIEESKLRNDKQMYYYGHSLQSKIMKFVRKPCDRVSCSNKLNFYEVLTSRIKMHKLANCGEMARLASLACAVNGLNAKIATLWSVNKDGALIENIDHAVVVVSPKEQKDKIDKVTNFKDTIIIDAWLGIADYAENIQVQYKGLYSKLLGLDSKTDVAIDLFDQSESIPKEDYKSLRKAYPELIIEKK